MMNALLQGLIIGLLLSLFIGATFFILIETSINKGFKPALAMNLGVFLSDISIILIAYFGANDFLGAVIENNYFKLGGGIAFLGFGNYYLFRKYRVQQVTLNSNFRYTKLFLNGFLINTLNPSVIAFWLGTLVLALSYHHFNSKQTFIFFATCCSTVIFIDILKIFFASKLKNFLNEKMMRIICIVTGMLFIFLGVKIILFIYF